ncbi:MAG: restriction endonuclease subunit S [Magnetococcales bacterium]|nr:restriction endonuclease subunit S [Magnetococcales bacterium]
MPFSSTGKELFKIRMNHEIFIGSSNHTFLSRIAVEKGFVLITSGGTIGRVMYVRGNFEGSAVSEDVLRIVPNGNIHPGYIYSFLASSFGQSLIQRYSYGSVIPRIHRTHIEDISIPIPDDNGKEIGQKVDAAFDKRAEALAQENRAIALFDEALRLGRERTEADWGREYDA